MTFIIVLFYVVLFVVVFGVMVVFFVSIASLPLYLIGKHQDKKRIELNNWAENNGYQNIATANSAYSDVRLFDFLKKGQRRQSFYARATGSGFATASFLPGSSFTSGGTNNAFRGSLQDSKNEFAVILQSEHRGSGKSSVTYRRTIMKIAIPNTKLHMIINSKVNLDSESGDNLANYNKGQKYLLEGVFGQYFEIFMPDNTQSEALSILGPDTMQFILENLSDFDIEISNDNLYLYTYKHLNGAAIGDLISKADVLITESRLKPSDSKLHKISLDSISRRVEHDNEERKLKSFDSTRIFIFLLGLSWVFFIPGSIMQSRPLLLIGTVIFLGAGLFPILIMVRDRIIRLRFKRSINNFRNTDKS